MQVVCSNDVSILHSFRYITTFRLAVYVIAGDLEKSFSLDKPRALSDSYVNISLSIHDAVFPEVLELERLHTAK